jgi:hypothetical protein
MATNEQVVDWLVAVDFPASKDDLVAEAERNGAPEDVVKALRAMPPVDYASKAEVQRSALRTEAEESAGPTVEAERARSQSTSRVAAHLRD